MNNLSSLHRALPLVSCALLLSTSDAGAGWSSVSLHPTSGGYDESFATAVSGGQIGGNGLDRTSATEFHPYPGIWNSPSGGTFTRVGSPDAPAFVLGVSGGLQAGYSNNIATWWKGGSEFYVVDTVSGVAGPVLGSFLYGISGGWVGGKISVDMGERALTPPMIWKLTDNFSEAGINLTPSGEPDFTGGTVMAISGASGSNPGVQVGSLGLTLQRAAFWQGTAASYVSLHPDQVPRWNASVASAIFGTQQGGTVELYNESTGKRLDSHAALWSGTAASFVDLHPISALADWDSFVLGMTDGFEVGYLMSPDGQSYEAALWQGTATSYLNLNAFLPAGYRNGIAAAADWVDGRLWVVGSATNDATGHDEAILWTYEAPEPSTLALLGFGVLGSVPWRKRHVLMNGSGS